MALISMLPENSTLSGTLSDNYPSELLTCEHFWVESYEFCPAATSSDRGTIPSGYLPGAQNAIPLGTNATISLPTTTTMLSMPCASRTARRSFEACQWKRAQIFRHLDALRSDARNHTIPLLNVIPFTGTEWTFVVMPYCRRFNSPPFHCRNEFVDAMTQYREGLQFMHEHNTSGYLKPDLYRLYQTNGRATIELISLPSLLLQSAHRMRMGCAALSAAAIRLPNAHGMRRPVRCCNPLLQSAHRMRTGCAALSAAAIRFTKCARDVPPCPLLHSASPNAHGMRRPVRCCIPLHRMRTGCAALSAAAIRFTKCAQDAPPCPLLQSASPNAHRMRRPVRCCNPLTECARDAPPCPLLQSAHRMRTECAAAFRSPNAHGMRRPPVHRD
ncbi:hypothetical protein K438DRAFT_1976832 [Mycena galopus ATCC 62051]|nr:hypothetical protein K438DRAFT_1976832 [Mycena galopus ATCC 62051]